MRLFADTDVCLGLLTGRMSFNKSAQQFFALAVREMADICISSLTFCNIEYILQSQYKFADTRKILKDFKTVVSVLSVDNKIIEHALNSDFIDFEDAVQNFTAHENNIPIIITRNVKDFTHSKIRVMTPETFLSGL